MRSPHDTTARNRRYACLHPIRQKKETFLVSFTCRHAKKNLFFSGSCSISAHSVGAGPRKQERDPFNDLRISFSFIHSFRVYVFAFSNPKKLYMNSSKIVQQQQQQRFPLPDLSAGPQKKRRGRDQEIEETGERPERKHSSRAEEPSSCLCESPFQRIESRLRRVTSSSLQEEWSSSSTRNVVWYRTYVVVPKSTHSSVVVVPTWYSMVLKDGRGVFFSYHF